MKKAVLSIFLLFVLPIALASSMTIEPVKDQISPYDRAEFIITIHNTGDSDKFVLSYDDLDWSISTDPLTDYTTGIFAGAGQTVSTILIAKPTSDDEKVFKRHSLEIAVRSDDTGEELSSIINIDVRKDLIVYPLNLNVEFLMPEEIFPARANSVKVRLQNNNPLNISNISIALESGLFEKKAYVSLEPKAQKIVDFSVELELLTPPQKDEARLKVTLGSDTIANIAKPYSVVPYGSFYSQEKTDKTFLGERRTITFTNTGNSEQTEAVLIKAGGAFSRLFSSTSPATKQVRIGGDSYYTSNLTLGVSGTGTFTVRTSYAPVLYIIIILIVAGILYFAFRAPLIAAKEVKEIDVSEGGIARLSVLVKLKNRGSKPLKRVKVVEKIPSIAKVQIKESETLRPSKHYLYREGMVMEYDLGKMEPGEIRFISYHMKTKLAVVGGLRLKPVIVQYDGKKAYSNPVEVYTP